MAPDKTSCLVVSDFNAANLAGYLNHESSEVSIAARVAPMGSVMATLLDRSAAVWLENPYLTVVWTQPQSTIEGFAAIQRHEAVEDCALEANPMAF